MNFKSLIAVTITAAFLFGCQSTNVKDTFLDRTIWIQVLKASILVDLFQQLLLLVLIIRSLTISRYIRNSTRRCYHFSP